MFLHILALKRGFIHMCLQNSQLRPFVWQTCRDSTHADRHARHLLQKSGAGRLQLYNHNHQLNWWFALALKGPYASSVSRRTEKVCQPHDFLRLRLKALFYYLLFLATRERVDIFFHTYLVICDVLLQLISDVLFYRFFVSSNCIYIISSTPEMSISIFIF